MSDAFVCVVSRRYLIRRRAVLSVKNPQGTRGRDQQVCTRWYPSGVSIKEAACYVYGQARN